MKASGCPLQASIYLVFRNIYEGSWRERLICARHDKHTTTLSPLGVRHAWTSQQHDSRALQGL